MQKQAKDRQKKQGIMNSKTERATQRNRQETNEERTSTTLTNDKNDKIGRGQTRKTGTQEAKTKGTRQEKVSKGIKKVRNRSRKGIEKISSKR